MLLVLVAFVAATAGPTIATASPAHATTTRRRANILFVLTDDLDQAELRFMPNTRRLIGGAGATFDRYFVSNSLCCPSRVTTLRGQYAHNTGIWANGGTNGGFEHALTEGIEQDTVATRLSGSGYRTALVGKYLNGYPNTVAPTYRPPGWHTFVSPALGKPYGEYHYVLNDNGRLEFHGAHRRDYGTTRVLAPHRALRAHCRARRQTVLRVPRGLRAAPAGNAGTKGREALPTRSGTALGRVQPARCVRDAEFHPRLTAFQPW